MKKIEFQKNLFNRQIEIIRLPYLKYSNDKIRDRNIESYKHFDRKKYKIKVPSLEQVHIEDKIIKYMKRGN